jgi:hypothetical protein
LLINDHLLKGSGWLPGWLTGKLSDFAFLVVVPVLGTTLLPMRLRGRRSLAFLVLVGIYVATDLSPDASDAVVEIAAQLGMAWRLWPDVTDLVALVILPLAWQIAGAQTSCKMRKVFGQRVLKLAGLGLGTFASLATSEVPRYDHQPFLVNRGAAAVNVAVTWSLRQITCGGSFAALAAGLTLGDFDDPRRFGLASGSVAALDQPPQRGQPASGSCSNRGAGNWRVQPAGSDWCVVGLVEVDGWPSGLFRARPSWPESERGFIFDIVTTPAPTRSLCAPTMPLDADPGHGALSLTAGAGGWGFFASKRMEFLPATRAEIEARPWSTGCRKLRDEARASHAAVRACALDADCQAIRGVPIPGDGTACAAHVNRQATSDHFAAQIDRWRAECTFVETYCGSAVSPSFCRGGLCQAAPVDAGGPDRGAAAGPAIDGGAPPDGDAGAD